MAQLQRVTLQERRATGAADEAAGCPMASGLLELRKARRAALRRCTAAVHALELWKPIDVAARTLRGSCATRDTSLRHTGTEPFAAALANSRRQHARQRSLLRTQYGQTYPLCGYRGQMCGHEWAGGVPRVSPPALATGALRHRRAWVPLRTGSLARNVAGPARAEATSPHSAPRTGPRVCRGALVAHGAGDTPCPSRTRSPLHAYDAACGVHQRAAAAHMSLARSAAE